MDIKPDVIAAIGNTPLIKLKKASELTGCTILGKAEFMNPGQSVKDRAALFIIKDAIAKGQLRPGGTIVEGTAGNTGIGLAVVANAMGFKTVIVIPETQSQEKKDALRLLGAELVEVPAVPYKNPNNYVEILSGRLAEQLRKDRAERCDLGEPVRQCRQPRRPYRDDGAGNLETTPTARSTASFRPSARAARWAGVAAGLKAKNQEHQASPLPIPDRRRPLQLLCDMAS